MHYSRLSALAGAAALVGTVKGHGFVTELRAGGETHAGYIVNKDAYSDSPPARVGWATTAKDLGFVGKEAFTTDDIICHLGATNAKLSATAAAGSELGVTWGNGNADYKWPESHHGPVLDYLARCTNDDCTTVDKKTLEFFKIGEAGLISYDASPGHWASDDLIAAGNKWSVTIPSDIAPGKYVYRHEIIALHSAPGEPQAYPQCFNLEITGSGTAAPAGIPATEFYGDGKGTAVSIYSKLTYEIPGPALYGGGASGAPAGGANSTIPTAPSSSTSAAGEALPSETYGSGTGSSTGVPPVASSTGAAAPVETIPTVNNPAPIGGGAYTNGTASTCKSKSQSATTLTTVTRGDVGAIAIPMPTSTTVAGSGSVSASATGGSSSVPTGGSATAPTAGSDGTTETDGDSATTAPAGTTLDRLLGWLSSFMTKNAGKTYSGSTVVRRHVRSLA